MEKMGWTYQEYLEQPAWIVDLIVIKLSLEAKTAQNGWK
jgi:hypothetical protein